MGAYRNPPPTLSFWPTRTGCTVIMSYSSDVLRELAPEAREMLGIPESHYMKLVVGFGYPEIPYARGVQKGDHKVHRYTDESKGQLPLL